jgi:hypothetical protein
MPLIKNLIKISHSKALIIPHNYLEYYKLQGKEINQFRLDINKKIILTPIFEEIPESNHDTILSDIQQHIESLDSSIFIEQSQEEV